MNIILFALFGFITWFVVTFVVNFIVEYHRITKQAQSTPDDNWVFPIHIKYTSLKDQYFAWDLDDVFLGQSNNHDQLLTNIRKRWNIPEDKLVIKTTEEL
jgi:hypothetical protein